MRYQIYRHYKGMCYIYDTDSHKFTRLISDLRYFLDNINENLRLVGNRHTVNIYDRCIYEFDSVEQFKEDHPEEFV